jgi:hypothetical protein
MRPEVTFIALIIIWRPARRARRLWRPRWRGRSGAGLDLGDGGEQRGRGALEVVEERALLDGPAAARVLDHSGGQYVLICLAWCAGITAVSGVLAIRAYLRR